MKSTIVTGGAGFLGSHLVDALVAGGKHVVVLDNLTTGRISNLESAMSTGHATFVFADVSQGPTELRRILADANVGAIDAIYHLASPASPEAYGQNQWETLAVNGMGTMSLAEIALEHGARLTYSSTSEIYGDPLVHPQPESYFGNVDPIGVRSCYDEGKRFGEAAIAAGVRTRGLDARIVRFFNCYGPRMEAGDGRLVPALVSAAMAGQPMPIQGTGKQTRSMTYVDDAVDLLVRVATKADHPALQPVNIGNDDERSVEEIARTLARVIDIPFTADYVAGREGDPQRRKPDITIARSLGWSPTTSLEEGLKTTYAWFTSEAAQYA